MRDYIIIIKLDRRIRAQTFERCQLRLSTSKIRLRLVILRFQIIVSEFKSHMHSQCSNTALETFFSDVGGAAGLVLGMSLATIFGTLDCLVTACYTGLRTYLKRKKASKLNSKNVSFISKVMTRLKSSFD